MLLSVTIYVKGRLCRTDSEPSHKVAPRGQDGGKDAKDYAPGFFQDPMFYLGKIIIRKMPRLQKTDAAGSVAQVLFPLCDPVVPWGLSSTCDSFQISMD